MTSIRFPMCIRYALPSMNFVLQAHSIVREDIFFEPEETHATPENLIEWPASKFPTRQVGRCDVLMSVSMEACACTIRGYQGKTRCSLAPFGCGWFLYSAPRNGHQNANRNLFGSRKVLSCQGNLTNNLHISVLFLHLRYVVRGLCGCGLKERRRQDDLFSCNSGFKS